MSDLRTLIDEYAERALLAGCLLEPRSIDMAAGIVGEADFAGDGHGRLFAALAMLRDAGQPVGDPVVLVPQLQAMRVPENVTAPAFLAGLLREGVVGHEKFYAGRIRALAQLRRQVALAEELRHRASDPANDPADVTDWATARLEALSADLGAGTVTIHQAGQTVLAEIDAAALRKERRGAMTGLPGFDARHGAMMPGDLVVLAARPGVGKTALALQLAIHNAERGRPVLFVSLEMTAGELAMRRLCSAAGVDGRRVRTGVADSEERGLLRQAVADLEGLGITIWDRPGTVPRIRAVARCQHAVEPLGLLVVDYLGLVTPDDQRAPRHEQVARVSRGLKLLAKELEVPVLALAQLNRDADGERPRLSNLRDSGAIEQDADVVLMLHRAEENGTAVELLVEKHRHSTRDQIDLEFIGHETRFVEVGLPPFPEFDRFNAGANV